MDERVLTVKRVNWQMDYRHVFYAQYRNLPLVRLSIDLRLPFFCMHSDGHTEIVLVFIFRIRAFNHVHRALS